MAPPEAEPVMVFESAAAWEAWLAGNHASCDGVAVKVAKKGSGIASVTYAEALDVALCYGWIDGRRNAFDDQWFLQRFTPRRARSNWSKVNCAKVEQLVVAGRMQPAGLDEVERARADGRWDAASDSPAMATVPPDLRHALDLNPLAAAAFDTLKAQNRFAILYRVNEAKRPETRARRIEKFVAMLAAGETLYP